MGKSLKQRRKVKEQSEQNESCEQEYCRYVYRGYHSMMLRHSRMYSFWTLMGLVPAFVLTRKFYMAALCVRVGGMVNKYVVSEFNAIRS